MATALELRNEAQEALGRALKARDEGEKEKFQPLWDEYVAKDKAATELASEEKAIAVATEKYTPSIHDVRNPSDAMIKTLPVDKAREGVMIRGRDGKPEVVQFADESTEGWIKGYPASVQHPEIVRRLPDNLLAEADEERNAFGKWFRRGVGALDAGERKALARLKEVKALQEDTAGEGGFLVPTDQRSDVILGSGVPGGVTRPISQSFTTTRDSGTFPASDDATTWARVSEESSPGESNPTFTEVAFTIRKFMRINKVSAELLEDSAVGVPQLLSLLLGRSLGRYEDQQAIEGDGTTEPLGLRTTGAAQGNVGDITDLFTLAGTTAVEVLAAFYELPAQWRAGATWHMTSSFAGHIASIGATAAGIHFIELLGSEPAPRLLGRPIVMFDGTGWDNGAAVGANEEVGAIGDFSMYYFVNRVGLTVTRLNERFADTDQIGFAFRTRYDSFFAENDAFRILKGAAS